MFANSKKIVLSLIAAVGFAFPSFAVHEEFTEGYEFSSSQASSKMQERPMSLYRDGKVVFFKGDSAYIAKIGDTYELIDIEPCPELQDLGIEGTFAYDQKRRTIYFAKTDEVGNSDLYEAKWMGGSYTEPVKLEIQGLNKVRKPIKGSSTVTAGWTYRYNRISGFFNPSIAKGGDRIYFSADFPKKSFGGRDIWYIDRGKATDNTRWKMPENASDSIIPMNSNARDDYAWCYNDTLLYFASNRGGGYGGLDIYVSHLKTITRESTDTTTGQVNKEELEIWDTPVHLDSVFNSSSNDYNLIGSPKICLYMSNRTGGKGSDDIYRPAPFVATREPELIPDFTIDEPKGFHWVLMFFDFNVATMKPEYEAQLDELVSAMNEFPGAIFEVSGHTDSRGSDAYNVKLSQKRADYIRNMLINRGLDPSKLKSVGRGFHDPVIPNAQSEAEHEQNRRADIKILNE